MKNIRNFALVAVMVSSVAAVNAQSFELRAGAGATLVGNTFNVGADGSNFDIEVWYNGTSSASVVSAAAWLGIGSATSNSATAANTDGRLSFAGATAQASVEAAAFMGMSIIGTAGGGGGATPGAGSNNPWTAPVRPWVLGAAFATPAGTAAAPLGANPFKIMTVHLKNVSLGSTVFDNMLVYNGGGTGAPNTRNSGFGTGGAGGVREGSALYRVQAVPEPATMAVLGLGLAAAARRRRAK